MVKSITAAMTTLINAEVLTLATCWKLTRTDGVQLFITDHDADIVFSGDTYLAASGIARTAIESKADLSVDNLDIVGIFGGQFTRNDLDAGFYDFATIDIFSVNWQDPDGFGTIQHRFGTIGEMETKDGGYITEMRGMMQLLERRRGKIWSPDCRTDLFSPLVNVTSGRADGCGLSPTAFEEFGIVTAVEDDRKMTVNEFSRLSLEPEYEGAFGDVTGVRETSDGIVEMVLTIADATPMRPTLITNRTQFENVANNLNGHYALANDIDFLLATWTPIGDDTNPFRGTFDGRGHVINGLSVATGGTDPAGLFGACSGVIRRLGVTLGIVGSGSATEWAGIICGVLYGDQATEHPLSGGGHIEACWATGTVLFTDGDFAGGLLGAQKSGTIVRECWVANVLSGAIGTDVGALIGNSSGANRILFGATANTDAAGTTDLGNITGGNPNGLTDAEWVVQSNFDLAPFDFNDRMIMNTKPSTAVTCEFVDTSPRDKIRRAAGSWIADGIKPEDKITFTGTASNNVTYHVRFVEFNELFIRTADSVVVEAPVACNYTIVGGPRSLSPGRF